MRRYSKVNPFSLAKSSMAIFLAVALIVFLLPVSLVLEYRIMVIAANVLLAALLGWTIYKRTEHLEFSFDDSGYTLKRGAEEIVNSKWNEFEMLSLARSDSGELSLRLYRDDENFEEIPASKLRLDPFRLRYEISGYVKATQT